MLKCIRNTSTDVEKTENMSEEKAIEWKHLHGRGEDRRWSLPLKSRRETPPRTWRRH